MSHTPSMLAQDTNVVLEAMRSYRQRYKQAGHPIDFPVEAVALSKGGVKLEGCCYNVTAFASGNRFDGKARIDCGVVFPCGEDEVEDARLARIIARRAHLVVDRRERQVSQAA